MTRIAAIIVALASVPTPRSAPGPARAAGPELAHANRGFSQGVQGTLLDQSTGDPVRSAQVTLRGRAEASSSALAAETDDRGFFRLRTAEPGTYFLSVRALGYADLTEREVVVTEGRITVLEIRMTPEALELDPVVVTAEPRNFVPGGRGLLREKDPERPRHLPCPGCHRGPASTSGQGP